VGFGIGYARTYGRLSWSKSISGTLLNILSVLSTINEGIREVLPFIRYISNFVDVEWSAIQAQDRGQGVVCAATWIMPAALVPRPWDFKPKPADAPASTGPVKTAPKSNAPSTPPNSDVDAKIPQGLIGGLRPQLMVTSPTLPRGINAQQILTAV